MPRHKALLSNADIAVNPYDPFIILEMDDKDVEEHVDVEDSKHKKTTDNKKTIWKSRDVNFKNEKK